MASVVEAQGRRKHLASLAQVFRHRHGTWGDFGAFLKLVFGEVDGAGAGVTTRVEDMRCRHAAGGQHHIALYTALAHPESDTVFNSDHYRRPCISVGSFDQDKNPGLVVTDLCIKAHKFLSSIGKGDVDHQFNRDHEYSHPSGSGSSPLTQPLSATSDTQGSIDPSNILSSRLRGSAMEGVQRDEDSQGSSSSYGDSFFEEEDVQEELSTLVAGFDPESQVSTVSLAETVETLSDVGSEDSVVGSGEGRSSTKMRAATLAYLWKFADEPGKLRNEFRRLRGEETLMVLHLCGCGLCFVTADGRKVKGCCEKTHLILGTREMNGRHASFHEVMKLSRADDYAQLCGIIHRATDGQDLF